MSDASAAKNDSARDVDVIRCGNQVAKRVQKSGNGFAREDIAGEKNAGQDGKKSELHSFRLRRRFAGDKDAKRERGKEVGKRKKREQKEIAVNGHEKNKAHEREDKAELEKSDEQVRKQFAEEKAEWTDGCHKELFESSTFFFADDGKCREECGDVEEHDRGESRQEKIGRARIGIEKKLGAHVDGKCGAVLYNAAKGFVEADRGANVDGLARDGRVRAVDEHQNLRAHLVQKAVGIVDWDFDSDSRFAGDDQIVQVMIVIDVLDDVKGVGVPETVQELAAFAAAIGVVHDGVDLADVGVNGEAEKKHLQQRHGERKKQGARVASHVQRLFVKNRAEASKDVIHVWPPPLLDACTSARQKRLPGWARADEFPRRKHFCLQDACEDCRAKDCRQSGRESIGQKL